MAESVAMSWPNHGSCCVKYQTFFSSHEQQHSRVPAQQQGPLLQVPTAGQNCNYLPSSEVPSHQLRNIDNVIAQNRKLINDNGVGTVCQTLAKEAILGKEVME